MTNRRICSIAAIGVLAGGLATSASAQFTPLFNNLKCYKIGGPALAVSLQLDNQFDRERVFRLVPQLLCVPTQKSCCTATTGQCSPSLCPPEPSPNQPAPVDHFKCYKSQEKQCTPTPANPAPGGDCSKLTGRFPPAPPAIAVTLRDQFHDENVTVGPPKLLCVPVLKIRQSTTTTTPTTTTTTTTRLCMLQPGSNPPMCGGDCPAGESCLFNTATNQCGCSDTPCGLVSGACAGLCPSQAQQCHPAGTNPCTCCFLSGAPCTSGAECCSGTCNTPPGTCM